MRFGDKAGEKDPRGYHHGNLREALVQAALRLIAERGPDGFTFAEAAALTARSLTASPTLARLSLNLSRTA